MIKFKNNQWEFAQKFKKSLIKNQILKDIIFVGGYCSSNVLLDFIKGKFPGIKGFKHSTQDLAILRGSVIFEAKPEIIKVRKARYIIGQKSNLFWDEEKYAGKGIKYFDKDDKKWRCKSCFDIFIKIGQDIEYKKKLPKITQ